MEIRCRKVLHNGKVYYKICKTEPFMWEGLEFYHAHCEYGNDVHVIESVSGMSCGRGSTAGMATREFNILKKYKTKQNFLDAIAKQRRAPKVRELCK